MTLRAVIGFGSNLGDRLATMRAARERLAQIAWIDAVSHVYATAAVGPPQPDYLNAAALIRYPSDAGRAADPLALLGDLLAIEEGLGRVRRERWGPRTIDLDIGWIEGIVVDDERLVVPHPRLKERAFALAPMLEIVPDARDPRTGAPYVIPPGDVRITDDEW